MTLMQTLLLFGSIVLGIMFLMDGAYHLWGSVGDRGEQRIKRRLRQAGKILSAQAAIKKDGKNNDPEDLFVDKYFKSLILNADSTLTLPKLYLIIAVLVIGSVLVFNIFAPFLPFVARFMLALFLGFAAPVFFLKRQVTRRLNRFEEQFPDALELIVRCLRIGQPLNTALKAVADEMPDPIGKEFALAAHEISYGKNLPDAVEGILRRIALQDLRFFVVAVQIQYESGGNLAEVLEGLSGIIRGRFRLMRKTKALTAEGRFSAWFLSIFPVFMIVVMSIINPGYYQKVADYPYFEHLAVATAVLLFVNVIAMRIITSMKV